MGRVPGKVAFVAGAGGGIGGAGAEACASGLTDEAWDEGGYYIAPPLISSQRCPGKNSRDELAWFIPRPMESAVMKHFTILNREQLLSRSHGDQPTTAAATNQATGDGNRAFRHDIPDRRLMRSQY